jgi:hypothetical protein
VYGAACEPFSILLLDRTDVLNAARPIRWIVPLLAALVPAGGTIIDRIAVSVGNQVITTSDIDREIRASAFLQGAAPDFSAAGRRATADRMVEQKLIRRELETSRYPVPQPSEIDPVLAELIQKQFHDEAAYRAALHAYGITEQDVRDELLWQRTLLLFVDDRFRPAVQVTDQEIRDYFDKVVAPAAKAAHPDETATLEAYRDQIVRTLTGQRADEEMDRWLKEARSRTEIVYHPEAFE